MLLKSEAASKAPILCWCPCRSGRTTPGHPRKGTVSQKAWTLHQAQCGEPPHSILTATLPEPPSNLYSPVSPLPPTQLEIKSLPSKTETNLATSYHFHPHHLSLWGPLKPESETKTWVQVVYLRDEPRREQGP